MGYHSFSLDPRTILGVGPDASLDEIRDAYRAKTKKHHPDVGGDEWAFRMVLRAYEVLKTTAGTPGARSRSNRVPDIGSAEQPPNWGRIWNPPFGGPRYTSEARHQAGERADERRSGQFGEDEDDHSQSESQESESRRPEPAELRTVDVELIWTRFENEGSTRFLSTTEGDDTTLSVCIVLSWPPHELLDCAAEYQSTGATLRFVIAVFEKLRDQKPVIAARSRIEDGQFVGWLSYVDVLTAQDSFLLLRDMLRSYGLTVKLYTRDERVPFDWYGAGHHPVMSHSS